jgi:hypothetical protein
MHFSSIINGVTTTSVTLQQETLINIGGFELYRTVK